MDQFRSTESSVTAYIYHSSLTIFALLDNTKRGGSGKRLRPTSPRILTETQHGMRFAGSIFAIAKTTNQ